MSKTMMVPVESVEKAIEGARTLISNLQNIQKSRIVELDGEKGSMEDVFELLARKIEAGGLLSDIVSDIEKGVIIALIKKGYDHNVKLAEVLKTTPGNARQMMFNRGITLKEIKNPALV